MNNMKPVVYAEDDENDVYLLQRSWLRSKISNPLQIVMDGKMAKAYLEGTAPYNSREQYPLPALMLMDLSMPGMHGLTVLTWARTQPALAAVPIVIFSSSNQDTDVQRAYSLGVAGYMIKPGDPAVLDRMVSALQSYWLSDKRPAGTFMEFAPEFNVAPVVSNPP